MQTKGILVKKLDDNFIAHLEERLSHVKLPIDRNVLVIYVTDYSKESRLDLRIKINKYQDTFVIILSNDLQVSNLAWKIGADYFVFANDIDDREPIIEEMVVAIKKFSHPNNNRLNRISFNVSEGTLSYFLNDILYIKADGSYSYIVGKNFKSPPLSKRLKYIENKLCMLPQFYRFNRSYIFNLNNIIQISGRELIFDTNKVIEFPKYGTSFGDLKDELLWNNI